MPLQPNNHNDSMTYLLLRAHLFIPSSILPLQGSDEPLQHTLHAVLRRRTFRDGRKELRVFAPVCGELGQRDGR
jgi:hypothetical protein